MIEIALACAAVLGAYCLGRASARKKIQRLEYWLKTERDAACVTHEKVDQLHRLVMGIAARSQGPRP